MKSHFSEEIEDQTLIHVTEIFKALSDYNRLRIVELLQDGDASVGHITHSLNLTQSNVSHQLKILKQAQIVKASRQGQSMIYSIDDTHISNLFKQAISHATHLRGEH